MSCESGMINEDLAEFQTPNSSLLTPNSKLQTPNS